MKGEIDEDAVLLWAARVRAAQPGVETAAPVETPSTRDQRRNRRKRLTRPRTLDTTVQIVAPERDDDLPIARPRTRGECADGERPCPFVSCRHHLYLDVSRAGNIKLNFPDLEVWELEESCSLDIADRDGVTLNVVAATLNVTRDRVRQIEVTALERMQVADRRSKARGALATMAQEEGLGSTRGARQVELHDDALEDEEDGDAEG